ncbi:MAG: hypothetical protein HGA37_07505 [Lentimicrobium sp.]|nr:hypothetical protein [Lentimicrobium sp.]
MNKRSSINFLITCLGFIMLNLTALPQAKAQGALDLKKTKTINGFPKIIEFQQKRTSEPMSLLGENVSAMRQGRLLKDGVASEAFEVTVINTEADLPDAVGISVFLKNASVANGEYALEIRIAKEWYRTDVKIRVNIQSVNQNNLQLVVKPKVALIPLKVDFVKIKDSRLVLVNTEANIRRQRIQDAINTIPNPPQPVLSDWYPKTVGAIGGTLVISGKKLTEIQSLSIGKTELKLIEHRPSATPSFPDLAIYELPEEVISGDLSYRFNTKAGPSFSETIEKAYKTVDQFSAQWPKTRATLVDIQPMLEGGANAGSSSLDFDLNQGRIDAMRLAQYTYLLEYVPGNTFRSGDISFGNAKFFRIGKGLAANPVYRVADASGNTGFEGNTIMVAFQGYVTDVSPAATLVPRDVSFSIFTESYLNTRSAENDVKKVSTAALLEYNPLKEYVISNTRDVERLFDFKLTESWGTTSGQSANIDGSGAVAVGEITLANDIAFRIASGPVGTKAKWASRPFTMPHGWLMSEVIWDEKRAFPGSTPKAFSVGGLIGNIGSLDPNFDCRPYKQYNIPRIGPTPATPWTSPTDSRTMRYQLSPINNNPAILPISYTMNDGFGPPRNEACNVRGNSILTENMREQHVKGSLIGLKANNTLVNDHRVTFILSSIKVLGPFGKNVMDAINAADVDNDASTTSVTMIPSPIPLTKSDEYNVSDAVTYPELVPAK